MHLVKTLTIFLLIHHTQSAKILASVFSPSYSHQVAFRPLWQELAKRGHQITLLTTDPMKETVPNIKQIDLSKSYEIMERINASEMVSNRQKDRSMRELLNTYIKALSDTADWQFSQGEVRNLIRNTSEYFDLIMVEVMYPAHLAFADRFKAPFIGITSLDASPRIHDAVGNPTHPILNPDYSLPYTTNLTFIERVISTLFSHFMWSYGEYHIHPMEDANIRKHFGSNIRPLSTIQKDMDMLFVNINPIFHMSRPLGPNTVQIGGGTHMKESKPLPKDLQDFLDESKGGAIYFSLGTNVKSALIDGKTRKIILDGLSELPYKVLWKFEEDLEDKPANVKIIKWAPQQDILAHPNIKLFITQCGLQSMEEAIFNGVPMVGMPFFGDQHNNAKVLLAKGFGKTLDRNQLDKQQFQKVILETITNPIYKDNVRKSAELTRDVQMSGLETAVWWTEYVIRHRGARHFRSPAVDLPVYKYYLLDVIGFVLGVVFGFLYLVLKISKCIVKLFRTKSTTKSKKD